MSATSNRVIVKVLLVISLFVVTTTSILNLAVLPGVVRPESVRNSRASDGDTLPITGRAVYPGGSRPSISGSR